MTLVEAVLRQSDLSPASTSASPPPMLLRQLSKKEALDAADGGMPVDVRAIHTQSVLATDHLVHRHEEPDLSEALELMNSQDFSTSLKQHTLDSMGRLLDDYIRRTFDAFLATAPAPPASSSSSRSSASLVVATAKHPPALAGMLDGLRQEAVQLVMEFLDNRVGQDRESFLSMKRALVKEVHNAREVTHLFLHSLEQATTQKKLESVALMQKEYEAALDREKAALGDSIARLSSSYDTLWTLREISKKDIESLEGTIKVLKAESEQDREAHEKKVKKMKEDYREALDVAKNEQIFLKRAQDGTLNGDSDDDEDGEPEPEPVCESCEALREKLAVAETELRIANAVYSMKTAPPPKLVTESPTAVKTKKGHGLRSSHGPFKRGDTSGDDDEQSVATAGGRKERSKSRASNNKVPGIGGIGGGGGGGRPTSRQSARKGSVGGAYGRHKKGGGTSGITSALNSARRHVNDAAAADDDDESDVASVGSTADVAARPKPNRSKHTSFDSNMSDRSEDLDLSSMDRGHAGRGAPKFGGLVLETAEQTDGMHRIVTHFRLDPAAIPAVAKALADGYINRRPPPKDDAATQTQDSVDDLLRTYLEATKEVVRVGTSRMHVPVMHSLTKPSRDRNNPHLIISPPCIWRRPTPCGRAKGGSRRSKRPARSSRSACRCWSPSCARAPTCTTCRYAPLDVCVAARRAASYDVRLTPMRPCRLSTPLCTRIQMQLKERNLLLVEVTDQLTVARKKLLREQRIRNHIVKHDAPVVGLDRSPAYRREYALPVLKLDHASHAPMSPEGSTFLTGLSSGPASAAGDWSVDDRSMGSWSVALSSLKNVQSPAPDRSPSPSPGGNGRRPSTTSGNSVSTTSNLRRELRRSMARVAEGERQLPDAATAASSGAATIANSTTNFVDSHLFAKQARITDEAGHKAVAIRHNGLVTQEVSQVVSAINSDPRGKIPDQKMAELKLVRAQMVSILAHQVVDKKQRPVMLATAAAADEQRRGRGMALRSPPSSSY